MKAKIIENYVLYYNRNGKMPISVFSFCESIGITEAEFYNEFSDLQSIDSHIFSFVWLDSLSKVQEQEYYHQCTQNEKILSAVYAFIENLKNYRSYLLLKCKDWSNPMEPLKSMNDLKHHFFQFLDSLGIENATTGIKQIDKVVSKGVHHALFTNLVFVINYWLKDSSAGFENTDACIEKSFAFSFEMMSNKSLSTAFDLGKFLFSTFK